MKVRILVAIDGQGTWNALGASGCPDSMMMDDVLTDTLDNSMAFHWVEAEVPLPETKALKGEVIKNG